MVHVFLLWERCSWSNGQSLWLEKEISPPQSWVDVDRSNFLFFVFARSTMFLKLSGSRLFNLFLLPISEKVLALQLGQAFVFCDCEILVVACSYGTPFCECDRTHNSSFGQNTDGCKNWLKKPKFIPIDFANSSKISLIWHTNMDKVKSH